MTDNNGPNVQPLGSRALRGRFVHLEPHSPSHLEELHCAVGPDTFRYFTTPDFESWYARAQKDRENGAVRFTVRRIRDGKVVGSTSYFDMPEDARVEIGSTWYADDALGTAVNPETKLLLLANAFDAGYHNVIFRTCSNNARSRAAILKLGAKQDGILRAAIWMPAGPQRPGYFRDSVFYSILAKEWPTVRSSLEARLAAFQPE